MRDWANRAGGQGNSLNNSASLPPVSGVGDRLASLLNYDASGNGVKFEAGEYGSFPDFRPLLGSSVLEISLGDSRPESWAVLASRPPDTLANWGSRLTRLLNSQGIETRAVRKNPDNIFCTEDILALSFTAARSYVVFILSMQAAKMLLEMSGLQREQSFLSRECTIPKVRKPSFESIEPPESTEAAHSLELVSEVPLEVTVELGRAMTSLRHIMSLTKGSIIRLDRPAGDKVDVLVENRPVAKGEVMVVDDAFAVKITNVLALEGLRDPGVKTTGGDRDQCG